MKIGSFNYELIFDSSQSRKEIEKIQKAFIDAAKSMENLNTGMEKLQTMISNFPTLKIKYDLIKKDKKWYQFWKYDKSKIKGFHFGDNINNEFINGTGYSFKR